MSRFVIVNTKNIFGNEFYWIKNVIEIKNEFEGMFESSIKEFD